MLTDLQLSNLAAAARASVDCEIQTGCPAELSVAQWAQESGWGSRVIGNNCFGIKPYVGCAGIVFFNTWEKKDANGNHIPERLAFASFPTLSACFVKHAQLITQGLPYQKAWVSWNNAKGTPAQLAQAIAPIYANDPDYAKQLVAIMSMLPVQAAIAKARSPQLQATATPPTPTSAA